MVKTVKSLAKTGATKGKLRKNASEVKIFRKKEKKKIREEKEIMSTKGSTVTLSKASHKISGIDRLLRSRNQEPRRNARIFNTEILHLKKPDSPLTFRNIIQRTLCRRSSKKRPFNFYKET